MKGPVCRYLHVKRVYALIDNTAVRSSACQVKQLILSRSKALAGQTPPCAGGQGVEGAALHMPCETRQVDHLHTMAKTSQYNLICSVQRERRQEENAYSQLWQQWKKSFKKFYSTWSPNTLLSCLLIFFHYIY